MADGSTLSVAAIGRRARPNIHDRLLPEVNSHFRLSSNVRLVFDAKGYMEDGDLYHAQIGPSFQLNTLPITRQLGLVMQSFSWWGSCPDGPPAKIPRLAALVNRLYVGLRKRDFTKPLYLDEAALTRYRLRKHSTVLEFYRNKLVAEVFQISLLQMLQALRWNRH